MESSGRFGTRFRADGLRGFPRLAPVRIERLAGRTGKSPSRWRAVGPPQHVPRRVEVAVEFQSTPWAAVGSDRQGLGNPKPAARAVLAGVVRGDEVHPPTGAFGLVDEHPDQRPPGLIVDRPVQPGLGIDVLPRPVGRPLRGPDQVRDVQSLQHDPVEPVDEFPGKLLQTAAVPLPFRPTGPGQRLAAFAPAVRASPRSGELPLVPADLRPIGLPSRSRLSGRQRDEVPHAQVCADGGTSRPPPGSAREPSRCRPDGPRPAWRFGRPGSPSGPRSAEVPASA